jgi:hypothetical protein
MAKIKTILLKSMAGEKEFTLTHAQNIFRWQVSHPGIQDKWEIVGDDYIFDAGTNELRGNKNKSTASKSEAQEGA